MANDREFRLPKTLLAVLAVNAGVALAAYGSCDARAPNEAPVSAPIVSAPDVVGSFAPIPDQAAPFPDEVAPLPDEPAPSQVEKPRRAGAQQSPDAGWRDPCPPCGMG